MSKRPALSNVISQFIISNKYFAGFLFKLQPDTFEFCLIFIQKVFVKIYFVRGKVTMLRIIHFKARPTEHLILLIFNCAVDLDGVATPRKYDTLILATGRWSRA